MVSAQLAIMDIIKQTLEIRLVRNALAIARQHTLKDQHRQMRVFLLIQDVTKIAIVMVEPVCVLKTDAQVRVLVQRDSGFLVRRALAYVLQMLLL